MMVFFRRMIEKLFFFSPRLDEYGQILPGVNPESLSSQERIVAFGENGDKFLEVIREYENSTKTG